MSPDHHGPALAAFSESATDAPPPARSTGRPLPPLEQGADFRQPPGEAAAEPPAPAPRPPAAGLTFSDPDQQA